MQSAPTTFDEIIAPLGAAAFLAEHQGRRPLHLEGGSDKWQAVMNWQVLNRLLGMTSVWSHNSLILVIDKEPVPFAAYANPAPGRDGGQVLRPDPAKVKALLARGATLVLNDIDELTPELSAFARAIETALGAKLQANLYLSSKRKQGFRVHFDTHDVFAIHVMGEKTWTVFEGRAQDPIAHPAFKGLTQDHHEAAKGALWREVRLTAGDLLYLPRGQYHYALADEGPCAHIAFGATYPIGLDAISYLFERMVHEPLARANLPQRDRQGLAARLAELGDRIAAVLREPGTTADLLAFQEGYRYPRDAYDLPGLIERAEEVYRVGREGVRLVEQGGRCGLVKEGSRQAVEVPAGARELMVWLLGRERFAKAELAAGFPARTAAELDHFLADVRRMGLLHEVR